MKVLSLLQPWASLVLMGAKKYECRSWQSKYRGPMLIHASAKKPSRREKLFFENADYFRHYIADMDDLPYGYIICSVILEEIYSTDHLFQHSAFDSDHNWQQEFAFDDFSPGRFVWKLSDIKPLQNFLPVKGTLGIWDYTGEL